MYFQAPLLLPHENGHDSIAWLTASTLIVPECSTGQICTFVQCKALFNKRLSRQRRCNRVKIRLKLIKDWYSTQLMVKYGRTSTYKKMRVKTQNVPYMSRQWKNTIRAKRKAARKYQKKPARENWENNHKLRNEATRFRRKKLSENTGKRNRLSSSLNPASFVKRLCPSRVLEEKEERQWSPQFNNW